MNRRHFLSGLIAITAAPAIVRSESLMKIWVPPAPAILAPGSGMLLMMNGHGTGAVYAEVLRSMLANNKVMEDAGKYGVGAMMFEYGRLGCRRVSPLELFPETNNT